MRCSASAAPCTLPASAAATNAARSRPLSGSVDPRTRCIPSWNRSRRNRAGSRGVAHRRWSCEHRRRASPYRSSAFADRCGCAGSASSPPLSRPPSRSPGLLPGVSPLLWAMVLGLLCAPLARRAGGTEAGVDFAARSLLRAGVALLGLRIALGDVASLGALGSRAGRRDARGHVRIHGLARAPARHGARRDAA